MAQKGFAPMLYGVEAVHIGTEHWLMVVMEDVSKLNNLYLLDIILLGGTECLEEQHRNMEREALEYMHNLGLVHGDFRDTNLLIGSEFGVDGGTEVSIPRIFILDFDWAGQYGKAKYPRSLNKEVPWGEGVVENGQIRREHDIHFHNTTDTNTWMMTLVQLAWKV